MWKQKTAVCARPNATVRGPLKQVRCLLNKRLSKQLMDRRAGVVRIRPNAAAVTALARRILGAVARRVVDHLLERRRHVEDLARGAAVRGLEGG